MTIPPYVLKTIAEQEAKCMFIKQPMIVLEALKIAFYAAMIDAAEDDTDDMDGDKAEYIEYFKNVLKTHVESYQELVNENL